jgi:molybdopterin synthase sulfur carrier subunit
MKASSLVLPGSHKVKMRYFAALRDATGVAEEWAELNVRTAGQLFAQLKERHGFSLSKEDVRVAINGSFAEHATELSPNDEVVFIPPVSGG